MQSYKLKIDVLTRETGTEKIARQSDMTYKNHEVDHLIRTRRHSVGFSREN